MPRLLRSLMTRLDAQHAALSDSLVVGVRVESQLGLCRLLHYPLSTGDHGIDGTHEAVQAARGGIPAFHLGHILITGSCNANLVPGDGL